MKVLLDTCVWGGVRDALDSQDHDVIWSGEWSEDPGDEKILAFAYQEQRILITLDKDFGELAIVHNVPHCGIVRLVNLASMQQVSICTHIIETYGKDLKAGAIITAEAHQLRIRPPS